MGLRSARKDVDVRRDEGESLVGVGERLERRVQCGHGNKEAGLQPGKL